MRKFYVGNTQNLNRRIEEHNSGKVQSTKYHIPYELIYFEGFKEKKDALDRERKLKHHGQGLRRLKERPFWEYWTLNVMCGEESPDTNKYRAQRSFGRS